MTNMFYSVRSFAWKSLKNHYRLLDSQHTRIKKVVSEVGGPDNGMFIPPP